MLIKIKETGATVLTDICWHNNNEITVHIKLNLKLANKSWNIRSEFCCSK